MVAGLTVLLVLYIVATIGRAAAPAIQQRGLGFLTATAWDPNTEQYGILPQIWGTLYSSVLAVVIGTVLGLAVAIFLSERLLSSFVFRMLQAVRLASSTVSGESCRTAWKSLLKNLIELLAAIPSVVYGLWGIFVDHSLDPAGVQLAAREPGRHPAASRRRWPARACCRRPSCWRS